VEGCENETRQRHEETRRPARWWRGNKNKTRLRRQRFGMADATTNQKEEGGL
jgi:hypothetical protein